MVAAGTAVLVATGAGGYGMGVSTSDSLRDATEDYAMEQKDYDNLESALSDIHDKFIDKELGGKYNPQNLVMYEYGAPQRNLSCPEFYKHCESGKKVKIRLL